MLKKQTKASLYKKNILIIIPSLSGGGAEKIASNLANLFKKNNFKVEIICIYKKSKINYKINQDISIQYLNCKKVSGSILKLRKLLKSKDNKIIISFLTITNICIALSNIFLKKKNIFIYTQHEIPSKTFHKIFPLRKSIFIKYIIKFAYQNAEKIICVSKGLEIEMKSLLMKKEKLKCLTINNYIPSEINLIKKAKKEDKVVNLLSIGRLVKNKNFFTLLDAVNMIRNKLELRLTIVGDGELKNEILKQIRKYKLEKICLLIPFTNNLEKYYQNSDIYISTSLHESFGNTLVEAMHFNLFIISTDCPYGPREILNNGEYGILTKPGSSKELANAILKTTRKVKPPNYKKYLNKYGDKFILNEYKKIFKIYS